MSNVNLFVSAGKLEGVGFRGLISWFVMAVFSAGAFGCIAPRMTATDLPEEPIAFSYWAKDGAKKRYKIFEKADELPPAPIGRGDRGLHEENEIRALLSAEKSLSLQSRLAAKPGRLMLLWPRSGEITRVDAAPSGSHALAWSSDHKRLLFSSAHRGGKEQLYEYHLDTKVLRTVTRGPEEHPRGDYLADGRIVVLGLKRTSRAGASVQTVHLAGRGGRLGPMIADGIPPGTLHVAPGGDSLVYEQVRSRRRSGGPTVYQSMIATRSLESGMQEQLLLNGREPTLTPDGEWIVFASPSSAGYRLRRMRLDGTARVSISPGGTEERMPSVSPDGQFVVFVQLLNGYRRLTVRRFDGKSELRLLTNGWSEFPVW